jgi:hypothetical protein
MATQSWGLKGVGRKLSGGARLRRALDGSMESRPTRLLFSEEGLSIYLFLVAVAWRNCRVDKLWREMLKTECCI